MRFFSLLLTAALLTGCGYFSSIDPPAPTITDITAVADGTLVRFAANSDATVINSGVEYRRAGGEFSRIRQVLQEGTGGDSVLVTFLDDGTYDFRVFVVDEDGYYGYSPVRSFDVFNNVAIPCSPPLGSTRVPGVLGLDCDTARGEGELESNGQYTITITCAFSSTRFIFDFPRLPRTGIYTTTFGNLEISDERPQIVSGLAISNVGRFFEGNQSVYVENDGGEITLTLCELEYEAIPGRNAAVTGRYRVE